jgi:hypothetical protein
MEDCIIRVGAIPWKALCIIRVGAIPWKAVCIIRVGAIPWKAFCISRVGAIPWKAVCIIRVTAIPWKAACIIRVGAIPSPLSMDATVSYKAASDNKCHLSHIGCLLQMKVRTCLCLLTINAICQKLKAL